MLASGTAVPGDGAAAIGHGRSAPRAMLCFELLSVGARVCVCVGVGRRACCMANLLDIFGPTTKLCNESSADWRQACMS